MIINTKPPGPTNGRHSVIFADDDADTLAMLAAIGRRQGWDVSTASTAEELLQKVAARCGGESKCFDIVVSDVTFFSAGQPGLSGIAAGRQLERAFPNLPILFLTAYDGLLTRENIRSITTADPNYLVKPASLTDLVGRIEYLIRFTSRYEGPERRRTSVNRTSQRRRSIDNSVGVPRILKLVMDGART